MGKEGIKFLEKIHNTLTNNPWSYQEFYNNRKDKNKPVSIKEFKKWWNSKCDTITVWTHIYYSGDLLITEDKNLLKKKRKLIELGCKEILNIEDGLLYIKSLN